MVDRGRFPIRPTPSSPPQRDEVTDPVEADHELDIKTSSLAERELARLLSQEDMDFGSTTVQINARELDALLVQARTIPAPPASRPMLTTQPYDEVTAYALLDKDATSSAPEDALEDAEVPEDALEEAEDDDALEEAEDDDSPPIDAAVDIDTADTPMPAPPVAATPIAAVALDPEPAAPAPPPIASVAPASVPSPTSTPLPTALPPSPARASLPSAAAEWPGADHRKRRTRMVIAVTGALALIGILYLVITEPEPPPAAPAAAAVTEAPPPAPVATSAPKPQSAAEIDARKALSFLRDGMGDCVRRAIGTLPGSSPAVPPTMKQTSGVGYTATPADWKTAVWSCTKFRHDAPMQFQVQWQSVKPGAEALGIAWIDDDGDGEPDRALGFRATSKSARDVDLGEVGPMEMRPVLPVR